MHLLARTAPFWRGARCAAAAAPQSQIHLIVPSPLYPVRRAASIECDTLPNTHDTRCTPLPPPPTGFTRTFLPTPVRTSADTPPLCTAGSPLHQSTAVYCSVYCGLLLTSIADIGH